MPTRLGFTDPQRKQLVNLGCEAEQVAQLSGELPGIRRTLYRHARRNDVSAILEAVAKHAEALLKELGRIASQTDPSRAEANVVIERAYWQAFPGDDGAWSAHHMMPRLKAIAAGARAGIAALPTKPTRHRTADPRPIARIDAALVYGWSKTHSPGDLCPEKFKPSDTTRKRDGSGSVFREIAGICYEAAGSPKGESLRAIRTYLQQERARHAEALARLNEGLGKPAHPTAPRRINRTSQKI